MSVVDASALIAVLLRDEAAARIESRLFRAGETLSAPHLLDVEVTHVLRRLALRNEIDDRRASEVLDDLEAVPIRRYAHGWLLPAVWRLRATVTAYDAAYVALADALGEPLVTRDARLARAVKHLVRVDLM